MKRVMSLLLCGALLLALAGCDGDVSEATGGTTTTTAGESTTTEETTVVTTTTTQAPTTTETIMTTTTVSSGPIIVTDIVAEEGGSSFTLGDQTFYWMSDVSPLLEFLGDPEQEGDTGDEEVLGGLLGDIFWKMYIYIYPHLRVITEKSEDGVERLRYVFLTDDTYSFNGLRVGDTVETLLSHCHEPNRASYNGAAWPIGWYYQYGSTTQGCGWSMYFEGGYDLITPDEFMAQGYRVDTSVKIVCIELRG